MRCCAMLSFAVRSPPSSKTTVAPDITPIKRTPTKQQNITRQISPVKSPKPAASPSPSSPTRRSTKSPSEAVKDALTASKQQYSSHLSSPKSISGDTTTKNDVPNIVQTHSESLLPVDQHEITPVKTVDKSPSNKSSPRRSASPRHTDVQKTDAAYDKGHSIADMTIEDPEYSMEHSRIQDMSMMSVEAPLTSNINDDELFRSYCASIDPATPVSSLTTLYMNIGAYVCVIYDVICSDSHDPNTLSRQLSCFIRTVQWCREQMYGGQIRGDGDFNHMDFANIDWQNDPDLSNLSRIMSGVS